MTSRLRLETALFLLALGYLTVLPVGRRHRRYDDFRVRSVKFHTLVAALVGAVGAVVLVLATLVLPWTAAVILALAGVILATGGFHERGFAKAVDGLSDRQAHRDLALARMEQAALGPHGALALGLALALKLSLLMAMLPGEAAAALVLGQVLGAMSAVHMRASCASARSAGMQVLAPGVTGEGYQLALGFACALCLVLVPVFGVWAMALAMTSAVLAGQGFYRLFLHRIGGFTGAGLAGAQQMGELGALLGLSLAL